MFSLSQLAHMQASVPLWRGAAAPRTIAKTMRIAAIFAIVLGKLAFASTASAQSPSACIVPAGDITGNGATTAADVQCAILATLSAVAGAPNLPQCVSISLSKVDLDCNGSTDIGDILITIMSVLDIPLQASFDIDGDQCHDQCEEVDCSLPGASDCGATPGGIFAACVDGPGCTPVPAASTCAPHRSDCGPGQCVRPAAFGPFQCACPPHRAGAHCESCAEGYESISRHGFPGDNENQDADPESIAFTEPQALECRPVGQCAPGQCGPEGNCAVIAGVASCVCPVGYAGQNCTECAPGYDTAGTSCELGHTCRRQECGDRGDCEETDDAMVCHCDEGYAGIRCDECATGYHETDQGCAVDVSCADIECAPTGTCVEAGGAASCVCNAGYGGPDCSESCINKNCGPGGTCHLDVGLGALCTCATTDLTPESDCTECAPGLITGLDATGGLSCTVPEICGTNTCNGHGVCQFSTGMGAITCSCNPGFVGSSCWSCGAGLYRVQETCVGQTQCDLTHCSGNGTCTGALSNPMCKCRAGFMGQHCAHSLPVAGYEIQGAHDALEWGQSAQISAAAIGVGNMDALTWTLTSGPGTLIPGPNGTATYVAPSAGAPIAESAVLTVAPACCPDQGTQIGLTVKATDMPWVTGKAVKALQSIDTRVMQFMYDRCVGGAVVAVQWMGVPLFNRGYGRNRGRSTPGRPGITCGPVDPGASPVYPDSVVRIGSLTKAVAAGTLRREVRIRLFQTGRLPSLANFWPDVAGYFAAVDTLVESVRILDVGLDLVPQGVRSIWGSCVWTGPQPNAYMCNDGVVPPPVVAPVAQPVPTSCQPNPCFNQGNCVVTGLNTFGCQCPNGFAGNLCGTLVQGSANLTANGVDRRIQTITVGHLLRHTAGLPRSGVSLNTVLTNLDALRTYATGAPVTPNAVGPTLSTYVAGGWQDPPGFPPARFVNDRPSSYEFALIDLARTLEFPPQPGGGVQPRRLYSNLGFALIQFITEYTSGHPDWSKGTAWGGDSKHHSDHLDSLLDTYVRAELGGKPGDTNPWGATRSRYGMFVSRTPNPADAPFAQIDPAELQPRHFAGLTYNPPQADEKGVICTPNISNTACTYSTGAIDFFGNTGLTPYGYHRSLVQATIGELATEAGLYLRFAKKYLTGSTATFAGYARRRTSWDTPSGHGGSWFGARAFVQQVGWDESPMPQGGGPACTKKNATCSAAQGDVCCATGRECVAYGRPSFPLNPIDPMANRCVAQTTYRIPITNATTGGYSVDATAAGTGRCVLPRGLDFFVAVNQRSDTTSTPDANGNGVDYDFLSDAVLRALCEVDWPANPYTITPPGVTLMPNSP